MYICFLKTVTSICTDQIRSGCKKQTDWWTNLAGCPLTAGFLGRDNEPEVAPHDRSIAAPLSLPRPHRLISWPDDSKTMSVK
uniref:Uncharacterized protein n=1 Tax=Stegastes partitus TaxID=144197 RepID=A0A3B4Z5T0_9TELE